MCFYGEAGIGRDSDNNGGGLCWYYGFVTAVAMPSDGSDYCDIDGGSCLEEAHAANFQNFVTMEEMEAAKKTVHTAPVASGAVSGRQVAETSTTTFW